MMNQDELSIPDVAAFLMCASLTTLSSYLEAQTSTEIGSPIPIEVLNPIIALYLNYRKKETESDARKPDASYFKKSVAHSYRVVSNSTNVGILIGYLSEVMGRYESGLEKLIF